MCVGRRKGRPFARTVQRAVFLSCASVHLGPDIREMNQFGAAGGQRLRGGRVARVGVARFWFIWIADKEVLQEAHRFVEQFQQPDPAEQERLCKRLRRDGQARVMGRATFALLWQLCGSCVAVVWQLCASCAAVVCQLCGSCVAVVWQLCGSCLAVVWQLCVAVMRQLFGSCLAAVRQLSGSCVWQLCVAVTRQLCGSCVAVVCGSCVAVVWQLRGSCVAVVRPLCCLRCISCAKKRCSEAKIRTVQHPTPLHPHSPPALTLCRRPHTVFPRPRSPLEPHNGAALAPCSWGCAGPSG